MTGKEYRICASDTPSLLASEVTELLSQGWELYGHPFVGAQNGYPDSAPVICQAMVKGHGQPAVSAAPPVASAVVDSGNRGVRPAAVKPAPQPAPPQTEPPQTAPPQTAPKSVPPKAPPRIVRPPRPAVAATVRAIVLFLAALVVGSLVGDALVFRSGFYGQFLQPLSSTGTYERIFYAEAHRPPSGKKEVLVLGNSRMAEGFSARIANEYKQDGYWFSNCAIPASGARDWYYFVRDIDPRRDRYSAIAVPVDDFNDVDGTDDPADRVTEMWLVINRLRVMDILPYTFSFKSWRARFDVLRGSTFKGLVFQRDLQDFIEQPGNRLKAAKDWREHGSDWLYGYGGEGRSLPAMSVDWSSHRVTFPPGTPPDLQAGLSREIFLEPPQHDWTRAYQLQWLGALADLYRGSKTRIVIYQLPRNAAPRPVPLTHLPWTSVDELRKRPSVSVVDHSVFEPLEKPELFFDFIHLNTAGRKLFSPLLADTVKAQLH